MKGKTDILIVGYGNVGNGVHQAIKRNPDMNLVGIVTRGVDRVKKEVGEDIEVYDQGLLLNNKITQPIADVAILCGGSKNDLPEQGPKFARRYSTVDSFDNHDHIPPYIDKKTKEQMSGYFADMNQAASFQGHTSIISAGWDPGTFSVNRALMDAFLPGVKPQEFYGLGNEGGLSQGHSDAIRQISGVRDARQYTHAIPEAMERVRNGENPKLTKRETHWRECVVVLKKDTPNEQKRVAEEIVSMPNYFKSYDTKVEFVTQKQLDEQYSDMPHDGLVLAVGETGGGNRAMIEYRNEWESNPEATGNVLVACARACYKLKKRHQIGAYTMLDISPADLSIHSQEELLRDFM